MTPERIALIGFGEVGRTLDSLLDELLRAIPFTQRNIA
jgi:hypothetical protein